MVTFRHHFSFVMMLLLLTTLTYNVILSNAFESVKSITVHLTDSSFAAASYLKATLWFDTAIYQFTIDEPQQNAEYSLSPAEFTTIGQSYCMDASDTKIMLERDDTNAVYIDWITFETYSGVWYGIDGYCAFSQSDIDYYLDPSSSYYTWLQEEPECPLGYTHLHFCVDNDASSVGCAPEKQIFYFDTTKPNQSILSSEWKNGINTSVRIETCPPTETPTIKPTHAPSDEPSHTPSDEPSHAPSSDEPTDAPSDEPTHAPSSQPSALPTKSPTKTPINPPTINVRPVERITSTPSQAENTREIFVTIEDETRQTTNNSFEKEANVNNVDVVIVVLSLVIALVSVAIVVCLYRVYNMRKQLQASGNMNQIAKNKNDDDDVLMNKNNDNIVDGGKEAEEDDDLDLLDAINQTKRELGNVCIIKTYDDNEGAANDDNEDDVVMEGIQQGMVQDADLIIDDAFVTRDAEMTPT